MDRKALLWLRQQQSIQFQRLHRINVVPGSTLRYDRAVQHLLVPYGGAAVYPLPTRLRQPLENQRYQGPRHCPAMDFFFFSAGSWRGDDIKGGGERGEGGKAANLSYEYLRVHGQLEASTKRNKKTKTKCKGQAGKGDRALIKKTQGGFSSRRAHGLGVCSAYQRLLGAPARCRCGHPWNSVEPHRNPPTVLYLDALCSPPATPFSFSRTYSLKHFNLHTSPFSLLITNSISNYFFSRAHTHNHSQCLWDQPSVSTWVLRTPASVSSVRTDVISSPTTRVTERPLRSLPSPTPSV